MDHGQEYPKKRGGWGFINIQGQRFGSLTVVGHAGMFPQYDGTAVLGRRWMCRCDCGITRVIRASALRSGHTKSCGHTRKGKNREHMLTLHYLARHLGKDALKGLSKAREMDATGAIIKHMIPQP
jgi:hypothetical protein